MRKILFRGKRVDNGEWVYGGYSYEVPYMCRLSRNDDSKVFIVTGCENFVVERKTVCEYIGITDRNGVKIFEGDVLRDEGEFGNPQIYIVKWDYKLFASHEYDWSNFCEVLGNIYDNPELIGG